MEDGARVGVQSVWLSRCMLYRVLRYILPIGISIHHTHMVAGESDPRIQTALVAKWPEPIDVKDGIFVPGRVEKWNRELTAALRTYTWTFTVVAYAGTVDRGVVRSVSERGR